MNEEVRDSLSRVSTLSSSNEEKNMAFLSDMPSPPKTGNGNSASSSEIGEEVNGKEDKELQENRSDDDAEAVIRKILRDMQTTAHDQIVKPNINLQEIANEHMKSKAGREDGEKAKDWKGLHLAASQGSLKIVKALISHGANIDSREYQQWTPLMLASQNNHEDVVEELLSHGADPNAKAEDGRNALFQAAQNGCFTVSKQLLKAQADPNIATDTGRTPIFQAAQSGNLDIVNLLIDNGAEVNVVTATQVTPLHVAAFNGHAAITKRLLDMKANVDAPDDTRDTPLSLAARQCRVDTCRELLNANANVNSREDGGLTPLHMACAASMQPDALALIDLLIEHGADVDVQSNASGLTPLHVACNEGDVRIVKRLLDAKSDIEATTKDGQTAIFRAAANRHHALVQLLHDRGAKMNAVEEDGYNLLHMCFASSNIEPDFDMVHLLVNLGVDMNHRESQGNRTPLHFAIIREADDIVNLMLDKGASPE